MIACRGAADIAETAAVLTQQPLPGGFRIGVRHATPAAWA